MSQNADIQISAISALKMFADSRYANIEKKCRYADIADADINIGTPLMCTVCLKNTDSDRKLPQTNKAPPGMEGPNYSIF